MNPKEISRSILLTCRTLEGLGLVTFYNSPCNHKYSNHNRISCPGYTESVIDHPFGSLEQFRDWIKAGYFTCLLFDHSLIRVSYECIGNTLIGHNILYWPCPFTFNFQIDCLTDLTEAIDLFIESPKNSSELCTFSLRSPMRFDFDPNASSPDHPLIHLHTQFEDVRIYVHEVLSFPGFMKKVLRTFYYPKWKEYPELARLHEQQILHDDEALDPESHCLQIKWSY